MAKETDYKAVAQQIIEVVGGPENIISVAHCATRLRLIVKNREIIDDKQVEAIDIVKGCFFTAGQYQIILGTGIVNKVYAYIAGKLIGGMDARSPVEGMGIDRMADAITLQNVEIEKLGDDFCIVGYVK